MHQPEVDKTNPLSQLGCFIAKMTCKQKHVSRLHFQRKPHKQHRINGQCCNKKNEILSNTKHTFLTNNITLPVVIFPLMNSGFFLKSAKAAIGSPQFATGPQKCFKTQTYYQCFLSSIHSKTYRAKMKTKKNFNLHMRHITEIKSLSHHASTY